MATSPRTAAAVLLALVALLAGACRGAREGAAPAPIPASLDVVVVLADDLGWGELGCYGQELIPTPNLDRLAARGVRFTDGYSGSPVCAPSRCVLLTGLHTGHAQVRDNAEHGGLVFGPDAPEGQEPLAAGTWTLARALDGAGYRTGFVGKWGLGGPDSAGHPLEQGFDRFYGILCQRKAHGFYPTHLWSDRERVVLAGNGYLAEHQRLESPLASEAEYEARFAGRVYAPDLIAAEAVRFVEEAAAAGEPFFLVYASPLPHVALQVPSRELDAFPRAWDEAPYLGRQGYVPHPRPRAAYAAMIARLDRQVGALLDALERTGRAERTLVVFTSDNGPTWAGGVDAAFFASTGGLRGLKGSVYEGGVRVPFLVRLPGRGREGAVEDLPVGSQDLVPTVLELCGVDGPGDLDGESLVSCLEGRRRGGRRTPLYWELADRQALRQGDLKLVRTGLGTGSARVELFDLSADPGESVDLAPARPDLVADLLGALERARVASERFPLAGVDRPAPAR